MCGPDVNACCAYFCTGMSVFGIFGLTIFGIIIQSGGGWYLGVPQADNESAARACFLAAAIYLGFLVWCGCCVARMNAKKSPPGSEELIDEEAEGLAKV